MGDVFGFLIPFGSVSMLSGQLEEKFNTASNGQKADDLALKMVKEVYEPIVKAIDRRYDVIVQFK